MKVTKDKLDDTLDWLRVLCSVNPPRGLFVEAWLYRWLYDRALAHSSPLGRMVVVLAAISYLPASRAPDEEELNVPAGVLRDLLDVKGDP